MTDEQLMDSVRQGNLDHSRDLFELYHGQLYGFFIKLTRDEDASRDLVQNVFYRLLKYRQTYKKGNPFKAWIYQIARNTFADYLRKNKMRVSDYDKVDNEVSSEPGIDHQWEQDETIQQLHRSIDRLPVEDKQLLILSKFQKKKYDEIAAIMNYSVANVKVRVHRAIKKLRDNYYELENT